MSRQILDYFKLVKESQSCHFDGTAFHLKVDFSSSAPRDSLVLEKNSLVELNIGSSSLDDVGIILEGRPIANAVISTEPYDNNIFLDIQNLQNSVELNTIQGVIIRGWALITIYNSQYIHQEATDNIHLFQSALSLWNTQPSAQTCHNWSNALIPSSRL